MQRVLDVDLDFFVDGVANFRSSEADRLDPEEYPAWAVDDVMTFLQDRCNLSERLAGFVVERHAELFPRWRDAVDGGKLVPPFEVTHIDAHADLGLGDAGYVYLMTELLLEPVEKRRFPLTGNSGLADGNWLNFAVACRWLAGLDYVFNTAGPPSDILPYVMEGFDAKADHIQLAAMNKADVERLYMRRESPPSVLRLEPKVPFRAVAWRNYQAAGTFDVICLTRSAAFTPPASDALFDAIRTRFINETAFT